MALAHSSSDIRMCWLNSCTRLTKDLAEERLSRPGSRLIPTGVVMRDQDTGEMTIVEMGRAVTLSRDDSDAILRRKPPGPTVRGFVPAGGSPT